MIRKTTNILDRNKRIGVAMHLSNKKSLNILKINNHYGRTAGGLTSFMYDLLSKKGLTPKGNRFVQLGQIKKLLKTYEGIQIETAMLKANAVSVNAWGIKFIRRLLDEQ